MSDQAAEWEEHAIKVRVLLEKHARDAQAHVAIAASRIEAAATRITVSGSAWSSVERIVADLVTSARMARECAERVEHAEREAAYARREAAYARREAAQESRR